MEQIILTIHSINNVIQKRCTYTLHTHQQRFQLQLSQTRPVNKICTETDSRALHTQAWSPSSCSHTISRDRASDFIPDSATVSSCGLRYIVCYKWFRSFKPQPQPASAHIRKLRIATLAELSKILHLNMSDATGSANAPLADATRSAAHQAHS